MKSIYSFFILSIALLFSACGADGDLAGPESDTGVAGSYARFMIVEDFMYIIDDTSLKTFSLTDPAQPDLINEQTVGERIESIFHLDKKLFIGSGFGLFIYQIESDGIPSQLSATDYFAAFETFSCDPVVANATHAYVTLNSLSRIDQPCGSPELTGVNELRVYDISVINDPVLIAEYPMTAPKGLGIDDNTLFICDDDQGLKIFDISDPLNLVSIAHFDSFTAFDVIPLDGLLLLVGPENVYQFDYSDLENIQLISTIPYGA